MSATENDKFWDKGLVIFTMVCLVVAAVALTIVIIPYSHSEYARAITDLNSVNTCTGLVMFDSHSTKYNINIWDSDKLKDEILKKTEALKCP